MATRRRPVPADPAPKTFMAKALLLLMDLAPIERGQTKTISFRASRELAEFVSSYAKAAGLERTDVMNRVLATVQAFLEEAAPHAAILAVDAEQQGVSPARAIVRLALERVLEKYPELAKKVDAAPKK